MADKNVLYIAYYFPPMGLSGVQRTAKFVKYLPENGWKPFILTSTPNSYYAFDDTLLHEFEGRDIEIFRTPQKSIGKPRKLKGLPPYFIQKIGRAFLQTMNQPDSKIKWKKAAIELGENIIKNNKIDVIFATAPPFTDFLIARELSEKYNIPFVIDYRDMWVDNPFHFFATPMHKSYSIKLEEEVLIHTKQAIVITRQAKETLLKRYKFLSHNDISIIPHGFDLDDFINKSEIKPNPNKFTLTHSGVFQDDRSPKYFLKALSNFINKHKEAKDNIEARFVGVMRKNHLKIVKKLKLENNVVATGYVSHSESISHLLESDVLWLMLNDTVRTPGKLYEYFGSGKPMLICSPDGIIRKSALDSKAAIAVGPKDIAGIESAISTFYNLWKHNNLPKPAEDYIKHFDRKKLTSDLAKELALALDV